MRTLSEIITEYRKNNDAYLTNEEAKQVYEMATIGWFSELKPNGKPVGGEFMVFVNGSEGPVPHMHVWDDDTNGKQFHTCIRLDKPEYFKHGHKNSSLNKKQIIYLIDFLNEPADEFEDISNWKLLLRLWNTSNPQFKIDLLTPIPNYTKLI